MEEEVLEVLRAAKVRLDEMNSSLREGSLGRSKNDDVLAMINKLLPPKTISFDPKNYNPDLVYPGKNILMSENPKPQMQVMQVLQQTPPAQIAELEFVKSKFVDNYNLCHKEKIGELMYHRQVVYFKQAIAASSQLKAADPFSLYACFLTVAVKNYSLDPEDNEVYLYTMGNKAVLKRQAGAHVRRLMESRQIKQADQAKLVYKGDVFEVENGRVVKHVEKFETEGIIAGYVRFELHGGADRFFIYRKSDWEAWKKKSPQSSGDNWTGNGGQPIAAFLRTKIVLHATKEKCWATGSTHPNVETFVDIEVDEDDTKLPEVNQNVNYQAAMVVTPAGEMKDEGFVEPVQQQPAATVTYTDDDF